MPPLDFDEPEDPDEPDEPEDPDDPEDPDEDGADGAAGVLGATGAAPPELDPADPEEDEEGAGAALDEPELPDELAAGAGVGFGAVWWTGLWAAVDLDVVVVVVVVVVGMLVVVDVLDVAAVDVVFDFELLELPHPATASAATISNDTVRFMGGLPWLTAATRPSVRGGM